jgi:molybdenum cofactor cytidylyltransferase
MTVTGIILAAGASSRMGRPKALLTWRGETFLDRLIRLLGASCDAVIVVLGEQEAMIRQGASRIGECQVIVNPHPERGQFSSLRLALTQTPGAALFIPVDMPLISSETVDVLVEALREGFEGFLLPRYQGRRGHPAACGVWGTSLLLEAPEDSNAKAVIAGHEDLSAAIDLNDPGIVRDVDTPADYAALRESE